ncbi:MAG: NRDE family protein [Xanthomonadaceae bacterium]|jgi:uncharacterized protein with NRDE domain|nr:NRDE family protein [Xanthomonadaceae bacterium]
MCLIAFAWKAHPRWRLLLVGNRDEFHARPSAPLAHWTDAPIVAGRDLNAGGTWLGVGKNGRCSGVTNVRNPRDPQDGMSRGGLVRDFLGAEDNVAAHARKRQASAREYRPFNLLLFDADEALYLGNRPDAHSRTILPGIHGLSNADFDTPWPKTQKLSQRLHAWCADGGEQDFAPLFDALADTRPAPDEQLPDTGIELEKERWLSSAFICGDLYGTRASTVIAIDYADSGYIIERRFGPDGRYEGETAVALGD